MLVEKSVGFLITTACTLNCKLCGADIPLYRERGVRNFEPLEVYKRELDEISKIYYHVGSISITGGEPLLHKQLKEIVVHTLKDYSSFFDTCRITTNGTILPDISLLRTINENSNGNFLFVIDDYGEISNRVQELCRLLEDMSIPYRVNHYTGENQHCGGWVDMGSPFHFHNYSDEEVLELLKHCHAANWKCLTAYRGKLYLCTKASCIDYFKIAKARPDEYIDLLGNSQTLDEKKKIASLFATKALTACQYCNGFNVEQSERFPAGEQLLI